MHARVALSATVDSRAVETGSTGCTCTTKEIMHGLCLVVLLTNLMPRKRHSSAIGNPLHILEFQDPAAAKTWGRQEAAVPEHLGGTEKDPSPGSERERSR